MLKWFAPLLLFAGKPEVLIRLLVGLLAGVVLFFGVWLISNIAVTFDTLKNPTIAMAYGAFLLLFFVVVGMVAWLRLRALKSPAKRALPRIEPEVPLPTEIRQQARRKNSPASGRRKLAAPRENPARLSRITAGRA